MSGPPCLLIVNPNASARVTRWLADEAARVAGDGFEIAAVSAPSGLAAIETPEDIARAALAVVASIEADGRAAAAIIGAFGDPGLAEARRRARIPIVGLGEAGLRAAGAGGRRFSIVTLGAAMRASIAARAEALGLARALAEIRILPVSITAMVADREAHRSRIAGAIRGCESEAVLLGGAPFAGLGGQLAAETGRLVIDGVEACLVAVRRALGAP